MKKSYPTLWAGTDAALELYAKALEREADFLTASALQAGPIDDEDDMLDVESGVGVIQIKGVLTNNHAWYNKYLGLVSYQSVQESLYRAVSDPSVHEILLDISSPGGVVHGVTETVDAVIAAAAVKPVTGFSDSVVASAAMWIMAPAQHKFLAPLAIAGSIGVAVKHVEYSKARLEAGITETIIRAGEFKQLGNSSEPLSSKARSVLQEAASYGYSIFVQSMADLYNKSYQYVDTKMADGREFTGAQAVEAGLVDAVSSFDAVFAAIQKRLSTKDTGGGMMGKKRYVMSEAAKIAAAASGINLEVKEEETPEELAAAEEAARLKAEGTKTPEELAAAEEAARLKAEGTKTPEELAAAEEAARLKAEGKGEAPAEPTAMDLLKAQNKEKDEEIFSLKTDLLKAQAEADSIKMLKEISAKSINNMLVVLGGTALDLADATAEDIISQYKATSERFTSEFKVGGVAAVESEEESPTEEPVEFSRINKARMKASVKR